MPKKLPKDRRLLAALVAQMRFASDAPPTLEAIGAKLKINKATASRLLREARENNIIKVIIQLPREQQLEVQLQDRYRLIDAAVFPIITSKRDRDSSCFRRQLADSAARHIEGESGLIKPGCRVGISCGATIRDIILALSPNRWSGNQITKLTVETEVDQLIDQSPFCLVGMLAAKWLAGETGAQGEDATVFAVQPLPETLRKDSDWAHHTRFAVRRSKDVPQISTWP